MMVMIAQSSSSALQNGAGKRRRIDLQGTIAAAVGAMSFLMARNVVWGWPISATDILWLAVGTFPSILPSYLHHRIGPQLGKPVTYAAWLWFAVLIPFVITHVFLIAEGYDASMRALPYGLQTLAYIGLYVVPVVVILVGCDLVRSRRDFDVTAWAVAVATTVVAFAVGLLAF